MVSIGATPDRIRRTQQRRLTVLEHRQTPDRNHPNTQDDHGYLTVYISRGFVHQSIGGV
jgi:hypothetical protein